MTVIVINAVTLFLYAFPEAPAAGRTALYGLDYACTVFFVAEMVIDNTHDLEEEVEALQAQLQKSIEQSHARQAEIEERLIDLQDELDDRGSGSS